VVSASLTAVFSEVTGSGTFQTARSYATAGSDTEHIASADFNADGYADLVTTDAAGLTAYIGVRLNNGDGTFGGQTTVEGGVNGYAVKFRPAMSTVTGTSTS
jgi:hypothetical protein